MLFESARGALGDEVTLMAPRLKRNGTDPEAVPPRVALAEAIQARDTAQDDLAKATVALEAAQRGTWAAEDALEQAEKGLGEAREAAGTTYAEYLLAGEKPNGNAGLREARLALAAAEDTLAASQGAERLLAQIIPDRKKNLEQAEAAVRLAARAVIKAEAVDVTAELKSAIDRVHALRATLYWLYRQSCCADAPDGPEWQGLRRLDERGEDTPTAQLLRIAAAGFGADENHAAWAEWEKAAAALAKDATAALPGAPDGRQGP
jgi:hypothetical protein